MNLFAHPLRVLPALTLCLLIPSAIFADPGALSGAQNASSQGLQTPAPVPPPEDGEVVSAVEQIRTFDPPALLGLSIGEAFRSFGVPESVFSFRGAESWQDDVVFFYANRLYLFWYADRVWQVRLDSRFRGEFLGLFMGMNRAEVLAAFGTPAREDGDWLLYLLPDRGFPVRARFLFTGNLLSDAYIYRGDF